MATQRLNYSTRVELAEFLDNVTDDIARGDLEQPVSIQDLIDGFALVSHEPVESRIITESQMRGAIRRLLREYPTTKLRLRR